MTKLATNGWKEISHLINFIHLGELLTNLAPRVRQDIRRLIFRFGASGGWVNASYTLSRLSEVVAATQGSRCLLLGANSNNKLLNKISETLR